MGRAVILIILLIIFLFICIPNMLLIDNMSDKQLIKQDLNLSARVLINSIDKSLKNIENISEGYDMYIYSDINIDKERLLNEFYDILRKNIVYSKKFKSVKESIKLKILVYHDRFFIANEDDLWKPPYFFTYKYKNKDIYLNTKDDEAYYYDNSKNKVYSDISNFGISKEEKENMIINKLNQVVTQFTYEPVVREDGIKIKIQNPDNNDIEYKINNSFFNVLDGLTFFVVYTENNPITINKYDFNFKIYDVAGFTLDEY